MDIILIYLNLIIITGLIVIGVNSVKEDINTLKVTIERLNK
mgnify:FL=1